MYPHERSLVKRMEKRPFALIGVNSDPDLQKLRETLEKENITWRSFWNGPQGPGGPISSLWNVTRWPPIYIIDHEGIIRDKDRRGVAMDQVVARLVAAAEAEGVSETSPR